MRRLWRLGGVAALLAYGWLLARFASGIASGADNSGYLNAARLLRAGKLREPLRLPPSLADSHLRPWLFTPLGFQPAANGRTLLPTYPPGLPLQQAAAATLVGSLEQGAVLVNLFSGIGFALLAYRLGRAWRLSRAAAAVPTLLLAANPLALRFFTWNMSDGPAAFWAVAAVYFAVKAGRRWPYAAAAGLAWALGIATRPTQLLLLPALLLALPPRGGVLAAFAMGAAPLASWLSWYNGQQFGAWYRSGYANLAREFKGRYLWPTVQHYAAWMARFYSPLALFPWLGHLRSALAGKRSQLLCLAWWLPFFAFYGFYKYTNDAWWYLRFVFPAMPGLVLGGVLAAQQHWQQARRSWVKPGLAALAFLAAGCSLFWARRLNALQLARDEAVYPQGVAWAEEVAGREGVIFCAQLSGSVYFYSPLAVFRVDLARKEELEQVLTTLQQRGLQAYAMLFDFEARVYPRVFPGMFQKLGERGRLSLWRVSWPEEGGARNPWAGLTPSLACDPASSSLPPGSGGNEPWGVPPREPAR